MTKDEAYEKQRRERIALERENKKLIAIIEDFNKDTYVSAEKAANLKQINKLTQENRHLNNQVERYKKYWRSQISVAENFRVAAIDAEYERDQIKNELEYYRKRTEELEARLNVIMGENTSHNEDLQAQISALKEALLKEKAKADNDGTNSGTPTSQTPYGKKKVIPNSREKSDKNKGAQPGHKKHNLSCIPDDEITDDINHTLDQCPDCASTNLVYLGEKDKDVIDYEVVLKKIRHHFYYYRCQDCGKDVHSPVPLHLKESVQYGANIQALGLALQNIGFVSINRTQKLINGIIGNNINISQGYLCKLQKRASKVLKPFIEELRIKCILSKLLHWDDTVIFINTSQSCMRFYGNDRLALYKAHEKKNRAGIDEDKILGALGSDTVVVHDHVAVNYNDDFHFRNAECVQHLLREIQKVAEISKHSWAASLKELIIKTIHSRNDLAASGADGFTPQERRNFFHELDELLDLAETEHIESKGHYYADDERKLINRINKYKHNYFLWVRDFSIPPTNNLAERSLRGQKVKQKVSGQFLSVETASCFADIRSYIETCYRNGVNTFEALIRLASGNPYTVKELLGEA